MRRIPIPPESLPATDCTGQHIELPAQAAHYARDVLRLSPQSEHLLIDGQGRRLRCQLTQLNQAQVIALILTDERGKDHESPLSLTLYQAMPKGDRWEWILEKSAELGVTHIVPLHAARSVVRISPDKAQHKLERWQKLLISATRQCHRDLSPTICAPLSLEQAIAHASHTPQALHIICHAPTTTSTAPLDLHALPSPKPTHASLWIGPEGGFSDQEADQLSLLGQSLILGPRTLRAETAAIAMLALIQHHLGDLN